MDDIQGMRTKINTVLEVWRPETESSNEFVALSAKIYVRVYEDMSQMLDLFEKNLKQNDTSG